MVSTYERCLSFTFYRDLTRRAEVGSPLALTAREVEIVFRGPSCLDRSFNETGTDR